MVQNGANKYYLGVEIGGTKQQIAIGLEDGSIIEIKQVKLIYKKGAEDILAWLLENISLLLENKMYYGNIQSIGVGFGGPLEHAAGRVLSSLQVPGWENFKLKDWFESKFGIPTVVINDTVAGGFAELYKGAGIGAEALFYTNIGTGIGGGFYFKRSYYDGCGYGASYLGNTLVPDWTAKRAGEWKRLELLCSGKSIENRLNADAYVPKESTLSRNGQPICCSDLAKEARGGDIFAARELDRIAESFSIALVNMLALFGADVIVIGGGVAKMGKILMERIERKTNELAFIANKGRYHILQSQLLDDAVLVGALLAAAGKSSV